MLRIMAGMAQKDSYSAGFVSIWAGFARDAALRAVFLLFLSSASRRILAILAEEAQAALVVDNSGMFMVGFDRDDALRAVFPSCLQAPDACHHGQHGQEGAFRGAVHITADFPQLQFIAGRRFPCRGAEAGSHGPDCSSDHRDSPVAREQGDRCPCYAGCVSSTGRHHPCRDPEADPRGLVEHGDSAVVQVVRV